MGTAIKHPVPDRVKPSFVIFDIRTCYALQAYWVTSLNFQDHVTSSVTWQFDYAYIAERQTYKEIVRYEVAALWAERERWH